MNTDSKPSRTTPKPKKIETLTDWMRVRMSFLFDPIVDFFARYHLSPDVLTVSGMLAHFFIAWLVAYSYMTWAGIAMLLIAPLDALDGSLARKVGRKQNGFGAFLDSTLDRLAEIILFGGFITYYTWQGNATLLAVAYIAITGSLMVSYSRGRAEALGFTAKNGFLGRFERYAVMTILLILNLPEVSLIILAVFTYITVAQRMYFVWKQAKEANRV